MELAGLREPARGVARQQGWRHFQAHERGSLSAAFDGAASGRLPVLPSPNDPAKHLTFGEHYGGWCRTLKAASVPHVGTHGIRHRSTTDIANSGVPTKVGMKLTGHKTVAMFMHYVHTEDKPVREAAELVASRRQAITGARQLAEAVA